MAVKDERAKATLRAGQHATSGRMDVVYRDARGYTHDATVLGAGTTSGLRIQLTSNRDRIIDNVPKATTVKSTGAYFSRI